MSVTKSVSSFITIPFGASKPVTHSAACNLPSGETFEMYPTPSLPLGSPAILET